jgi:hypothetical protein
MQPLSYRRVSSATENCAARTPSSAAIYLTVHTAAGIAYTQENAFISGFSLEWPSIKECAVSFERR